jgi:small-conductance mechanosensitive channel
MAIFEKLILHITVLNWLIAILVVVVSYAVLTLVKKFLVKKLGAFAAKTDTKLDDLVVTLLEHTHPLSIVMVSLFVGSWALSLPPKVNVIIQKTIVLTLLIQGALWSNQFVTYWFNEIFAKRVQNASLNPSARAMLNFVARLVLWTVAILLILDNLGFNITTLIAGLGVGGIAVALAVQNILADLFASLSIILDKPFVVGDFIIVDDFLGTVKHVGLKTTRIQSLSGEEVIFSNGDLLKSRIRNYKRMYERRVVFSVGIPYETPADKLSLAKTILTQTVQAQQQVRFDRAHFKEYGDSALVYEIVYYVLDPDYNKYMDTQESINIGIFRRFSQEGIGFAYPTRTVIVRSESGAGNTAP